MKHDEGNLFQKLVNKLKFKKGISKTRNIQKNIEKNLPSKVKTGMDSSLNFTKKSPEVQGFGPKSNSTEDDSMVDFTQQKGMSGAESSLALTGEKNMSSVIAISLKNYNELTDMAKNSLTELIENSKGKGLADYRGEYIFIVFTPLVTRTYKNESLAVKCAKKILQNLEVHNKKFKDKIEFGIGVHQGDLVASKKGDRLKYTGIGNTISFAKRMSDSDSKKVIISEEIRKKLIRDVKAEKGKEIGENQTYVLSEVVDRSADAAKLKELLKRQKSI
jgi:hypothetical protein